MAIKKIFIFCLMATSILFSSCTKEKRNPDVLRIGNAAEPETLDPHLATGVTERNILLNLYERLVGYDPKTLEPVPAAAYIWELSEDKKKYTFFLRAAKWSDGTIVKANDFVRSYKRVLTKSTGSPWATFLFPVLNAEKYYEGKVSFEKVGIKALEDHVLEIQLKHPVSYFLKILQSPFLSPVHVDFEKFPRLGAPTNGPFWMSDWKPQEVIRLKRRENYWDAKKIRLKEVEFYPYDSLQTEERNFQKGHLDVTSSVPSQKIEAYQKSGELRSDPYFGTYFYRLNVKRPPLNRKDVRQALSRAIDRAAIVEHVLKGGQTPASHLVPRVEEEELGNPPSNEDKKKFEDLPGIEILFNTSENHRKIAEVIQQQWKEELGINVSLRNEDWKVFLSSQKNLNYMVSRSSWIGDYVDDSNFLEIFTSGHPSNRTGWSNKTYDDLMEKASKMSGKEQELYYRKAEKILIDEAPIIPIYYYRSIYLLNPRVMEWQINLLNLHPLKWVWLRNEVEAE